MAIIRGRHGTLAVPVHPGDAYEERWDHDVERGSCGEERDPTDRVESYPAGYDDALDGYLACYRRTAEEVIDADAYVFDSKGGFDGLERMVWRVSLTRE